MKNKSKLIFIFLLLLFCFQSVVYSAFNSSFLITGDAVVRIQNNVRITNFSIYEVSNDVVSFYEEFSKNTSNSNVTLPYEDSYIIYKLDVVNYESVEMQLHSISGLSTNLDYELIDYALDDMICDSTGKCSNGAKKIIYLKIKYATYDSSKTNYNVSLFYEFKELSNVIMLGSTFKTTIPASATSLVFTDEKPASNVTLTDVSEASDMGVVGYLDGTIYKVSTRRTEIFPKANVDSSYMFNESSLTDIDLDNLDISSTTNIAGMFEDCTSLTNINFGSTWDTSSIINMSYLFNNCTSLLKLNLSKFNTSKVINMSQMFSNCYALSELNISSFVTSSVITLEGMFSDCRMLSVIDVSNWKTPNVTDIDNLFYNCQSVEILDLSGFDTTNVTSSTGIFSNMFHLKEITLSDKWTWIVDCYLPEPSGDRITGANGKWYDLATGIGYAPSEIPSNVATTYVAVIPTAGYTVKHWQQTVSGGSAHNSTNFTLKETENLTGTAGASITPEVKTYSGFTAPSTATVTISGDGSTVVNYYYTRNSYTVSLSRGTGIASVSGAGTYKYGASVTINATVSANYAWSKWSGTKSSTTQKYTFTMPASNVTNTANAISTLPIAQAIYSATDKSLTFMVDVQKVEGSTFVDRDGNTKTATKVYTGIETSSSYGWSTYKSTITKVVFEDEISPVSTAYWFMNFSNLTTIESISNLNTSKVSSMDRMFSGASKLTSLDLSGFNTANVTNMFGMFLGCTSLTSLNLSGFNTSKVTNMEQMFDTCSSLTSLNLSSFNTINITSMNSMFAGCTSLTSLNISSFNTSNVTTMIAMFEECKALTTLDLSHFNTSKLTSMWCMFNDCRALTTLDLSSFDTSKVTNMNNTFRLCQSLTTLKLGSGWNTANVTTMNGTFEYCSRLTLDCRGWNVGKVTSYSYFNSSASKVVAPNW